MGKRGVKRTKTAAKVHHENRLFKRNFDRIEVQAVTCQLMQDLFDIALHEKEKDQFGAKRCKEVNDLVAELYKEFCGIYFDDTADREYFVSVLDRKLKEIFGDELVPFEKRYNL